MDIFPRLNTGKYVKFVHIIQWDDSDPMYLRGLEHLRDVD